MYDDPFDPYETYLFGTPRPQLHEGGRLSHLVFLDGRLVDAWSEEVRDTAYAGLARRYDEERRPTIVQSPPEPPRHRLVLEWLDSLVGGRTPLLSLSAEPTSAPALRDVLDPVVDEVWLVVDELLAEVTERLLPADLVGPLRHALVLLHAADADFVARRSPDRVAAGLVWVVGKANGTLGPQGPVLHKDVARVLGLDHPSLTTHGQGVLGALGQSLWLGRPPWGVAHRDLLATGIPDLLTARIRRALVRLRDEALTEAEGSAA